MRVSVCTQISFVSAPHHSSTTVRTRFFFFFYISPKLMGSHQWRTPSPLALLILASLNLLPSFCLLFLWAGRHAVNIRHLPPVLQVHSDQRLLSFVHGAFVPHFHFSASRLPPLPFLNICVCLCFPLHACKVAVWDEMVLVSPWWYVVTVSFPFPSFFNSKKRIVFCATVSY